MFYKDPPTVMFYKDPPIVMFYKDPPTVMFYKDPPTVMFYKDTPTRHKLEKFIIKSLFRLNIYLNFSPLSFTRKLNFSP